ncbi:MAG TPA: hypothetical protein VKW08_23195 [Xanthobacteraceae bacterium]|nr:hypothetical protein [Xanthobacteraceae bacterium]
MRSLVVGLRGALAVLVGLGVSALFTRSAGATTYDLVADWNSSPSSNPNGPWVYLQGTTLLLYQSDLVPFGDPGFAPGPNFGNFLPAFWQPVAGGDISIHSVDGHNGNPSLGNATLTWNAPADGRINISGYLYYDQIAVERSNDFILSLGGTTLTSGTISYLDQSKTLLSFNGLSVTSGEVLSLTLERSPGQDNGSITNLDLTVNETVTPLPAAFPLFATGLGVIGLVGWNRKRKAREAL